MPTATPEAAGSSSILDNPELAESTLIALLCNKTDPLLNYGGETPKHLVTYARRWLKLVGDEFRDEVIEGLQRKQRGLECTINHLGPVDGAPNKHWLNVKIKEPPKQEDEEANPDPTAMHLLWLSPDVNNIIWYISMCEQQRGAPDRYRAIALDAEKLRNGRLVAQPAEMPRGKIRYVELASATTALQRVHALCHIRQLDPDIAAALTTKPEEEFKERPSPWQPLDEASLDPAVRSAIQRLNPGQRAALFGLDSAVTVVQGPPGTGKSSFITAACMTRVPAGLRILACTATNKAIDSLVGKLEDAGLTDMLCVGSRRAMGEASCRYLMSSVLERDTTLATAEAALAEHTMKVKAYQKELSELPDNLPVPGAEAAAAREQRVAAKAAKAKARKAAAAAAKAKTAAKAAAKAAQATADGEANGESVEETIQILKAEGLGGGLPPPGAKQGRAPPPPPAAAKRAPGQRTPLKLAPRSGDRGGGDGGASPGGLEPGEQGLPPGGGLPPPGSRRMSAARREEQGLPPPPPPGPPSEPSPPASPPAVEQYIPPARRAEMAAAAKRALAAAASPPPRPPPPPPPPPPGPPPEAEPDAELAELELEAEPEPEPELAPLTPAEEAQKVLALAENKIRDANRAAVLSKIRVAQEGVRKAQELIASSKISARKAIWNKVRVVACTASSALQVSRRLERDMNEGLGKGKKADAGPPLRFDFVVLDEAAAMLEPDAIGCLLHGARAMLLVGDQNQLPPFSKWKDADTARYTISLMARLATSICSSPVPGARRGSELGAAPSAAAIVPKPGGKGKGKPGSAVPGKGKGKGGGGGAGGAVQEDAQPPLGSGGAPSFMLTDQYRMHPAIAAIVSSTFYQNKVKTATVTSKARQHPMPACFVNVVGQEEFRDLSCFNAEEAEQAAAIVGHCVHYLGFAPARVNVLAFYNAQRDLLEKLLARDGVGEVPVVSVDSMQGREADVVIVSCCRSGGIGLGFVADPRRVNVALSRARESLIVLGSAQHLCVERIWNSALRGMQKYPNAREFLNAVEQALPRLWAAPRRVEEPGSHKRRGERSSADRAFDEPDEGRPPEARLEQRDSEVLDDWDASSDDDEPPAASGSNGFLDGSIELNQQPN